MTVGESFAELIFAIKCLKKISLVDQIFAISITLFVEGAFSSKISFALFFSFLRYCIKCMFHKQCMLCSNLYCIYKQCIILYGQSMFFHIENTFHIVNTGKCSLKSRSIMR